MKVITELWGIFVDMAIILDNFEDILYSFSKNYWYIVL